MWVFTCKDVYVKKANIVGSKNSGAQFARTSKIRITVETHSQLS